MIYITEVEELSKKIRLLDDKPVIGVDCETNGLDPHTKDIKLLQLSDSENTLVINTQKIGYDAVAHYVRPFLEDKNIVKTLHNAKFDTKFIKHRLGIDIERIYDTYLASLILEGGLKRPRGFHGLGQTLERYTNIKIDKSEQASNWGGELSQSQINYAATDAECLFPLREAQIPQLQKFGLVKCAKLEFEAVLPIAWLELCGFYLDFDAWMKLADSNLVKAEQIANEIYELLAPVIEQGSLFDVGINLNSHVQIQKYFRAFGVPMPDSTKEFMLLPLTEKYPIVQKLLDYRAAIKANSSFGEGYREFINSVTGRIHADFKQIGANTGRLAPSDPNLNQIPKDNDHRNCFRAEEGNSLIIGDYSQEELRLLAQFSHDSAFRALFKTGHDFHKSTAAQIFKVPIEKVDKEMRDLAKTMNFLLNYGGGAAKFGMSAGISENEARAIIQQYFNTFKGVKRWMNYQKVRVLETHSARTASGRLMNFDFDEADGISRSKAQRNAVNGPIQGTGADILKRALRVFYDNSKSHHSKIKLVNIVHDEMNIECPDDMVPEVREVLKDSMVKAGSEYIQDLECKVDFHVTKRWQKE